MPTYLLLLIIILIIPETPSGSYFADGFVTISILSIVLAGICCSASLGSSIVGRPSINNEKLPLPRSLTLPSISTLTDGTFSRTSTAEPEIEVLCPLTLITFLSIWYSTGDLLPITVAPSISKAAGFNFISPNSKE